MYLVALSSFNVCVSAGNNEVMMTRVVECFLELTVDHVDYSNDVWKAIVFCT